MAAYPFQRRLGQLVEVAALCILSAVSGAVDIFAKVIGRTPISSATGAEVSIDPSVAGTVTTEGE